MHTTLSLEEDLTSQQERFSSWYDSYQEYSGEPTTIQVHEIWQHFGGPEEGGWWFTCGNPIETHCIFSKEQAIKCLINLHQKYSQEEYEDADYDIRLAQDYAEFYPQQRPHYE
jgi:hypothetical protein